jgi:hypothetical protein
VSLRHLKQPSYNFKNLKTSLLKTILRKLLKIKLIKIIIIIKPAGFPVAISRSTTSSAK